MTPSAAELIAQFDEFIRRDPARRGLIGSEPQFGPLCPGHLAAAAVHLAEHGKHVAIVTGFYIPKGDPPAAETDGPLGIALLAAALHAAGMKVELITDEPCGDALRAAVHDDDAVHVIQRGLVGRFAAQFFATRPDLTHLIAIERVGPSHTDESIRQQSFGIYRKDGLPRYLGKHPETGKVVNAGIGIFGPYVQHDTVFTSLNKDRDVLTVSLEQAVEVLQQVRTPVAVTPLINLGPHPEDGKPVSIFTGKYGPYVRHGGVFATIPKDRPIERVTLADALDLITRVIERAGSAKAKSNQVTQSDPAMRFNSLVPPENQNRCHNMRGEIIDAHTAEIHELFDEAPRYFPHVRTIGIGDGGNEIGMGCVPWEDLERRLSGEQSGRVPCRVATDWNIIAGTSNWGAYALAAATLLLRGQQLLLSSFDTAQQQHALEELVVRGPAVDGVTRRREATVDGLPFLTYIQPWQGMRRLLGLPD